MLLSPQEDSMGKPGQRHCASVLPDWPRCSTTVWTSAVIAVAATLVLCGAILWLPPSLAEQSAPTRPPRAS
jgi:hypothetical protein